MLPIIRTFISLPAGVARMPFWRFTVLTDARLHPVGLHARRHRREAGDNWENWKDNLHYVDYAVVAAIVARRGRGCSCATGGGARRAPASRRRCAR